MKDRKNIVELVQSGLTYKEVSKKLNIALSTVSYNCKKAGITSLHKQEGLNENVVKKLKEYYKTHTARETAEYFNLPVQRVKRYVNGTKDTSVLTKEELKKNRIQSVINFRKRAKEKAVEYKGGKCTRCGYNKYIGALEFHHLDPQEKDFNIGQYTLSWDKMKIELDKCILLCSNCHREIHHEINKSNK